jgi:DNA-binding transcriptional LysR family regulator
MDITLMKTFIEVANTGSFVAACDRLFVTQSAPSAASSVLKTVWAILFYAVQIGAILTPAGEQFERYALSLLKIWEEARQQF